MALNGVSRADNLQWHTCAPGGGEFAPLPRTLSPDLIPRRAILAKATRIGTQPWTLTPAPSFYIQPSLPRTCLLYDSLLFLAPGRTPAMVVCGGETWPPQGPEHPRRLPVRRQPPPQTRMISQYRRRVVKAPCHWRRELDELHLRARRKAVGFAPSSAALFSRRMNRPSIGTVVVPFRNCRCQLIGVDATSGYASAGVAGCPSSLSCIKTAAQHRTMLPEGHPSFSFPHRRDEIPSKPLPLWNHTGTLGLHLSTSPVFNERCWFRPRAKLRPGYHWHYLELSYHDIPHDLDRDAQRN